MKLLFDTNVILDLMLDREPFSDVAARLVSKAEKREVRGYLCATTITTILYLASKSVGPENAKKEVDKLLSIFEIAPVNRPVLSEAIRSDLEDFDDAVLHEAAKQAHVQGIVTRNPKIFRKAPLPIYSPDEMYRMLLAIAR